MPKVSIIVPTYNVEQYLKESMESIINQTLKDIEIICVDDGSTDNSGKMLDEYAAKDSRIKVIHKENGGYGKAMNVGLDNATGEYIGIIEPDDWIELDMYENMYEKAKENNLDFVKGNYYRYSTTPTIKNVKQYAFDKSRVINKIIKPIEYIECFNGGACIWSAIYNGEFLKNKNIRFLETPGASFQDTSFWIKVLFETERGMFVDETYNHYRIDNTNSSVKSDSKIYCICDELHELDKRYKNNLYDSKIINTIKICKYNWNYLRLSPKSQKLFFKLYKKEILPIIKKGLFLDEINSNELKVCNTILYKNNTQNKVFEINKNKEYKQIKIFGIKITIKNKINQEQQKIKNLEKKLKILNRQVKDIKKILEEKERHNNAKSQCDNTCV